MPKKGEYFSAYSHVFGLFLAMIGSIFIIIKTVRIQKYTAIISVYCKNTIIDSLLTQNVNLFSFTKYPQFINGETLTIIVTHNAK